MGPMIDKPPPCKGLNVRIPMITPVKQYNPNILIVVSTVFSIIPI